MALTHNYLLKRSLEKKMKGLTSNLCFLACLLLRRQRSVQDKRRPPNSERAASCNANGQQLVSPEGSNFTIHSIGMGSLDQEATPARF